MVQVAVRQQDGDRLQLVLPDHLLDAGDGVLAGIDDHALLPGAGRHEIAVRTQASGWESGDKHARPTLRSAVERFPYADYRRRRALSELIGSSQLISRECTVHCPAGAWITPYPAPHQTRHDLADKVDHFPEANR
ncbi:hypothetical protein GCM10009839_70880 [Catenulispora yoronensis]|uniref:Uncharacterized protein n=1 Tax=Catenulispora yoronensis TaxID=450799 RepID=A0ABP5GR01_9ACTN